MQKFPLIFHSLTPSHHPKTVNHPRGGTIPSLGGGTIWVPHVRDGFIIANVGIVRLARPLSSTHPKFVILSEGARALCEPRSRRTCNTDNPASPSNPFNPKSSPIGQSPTALINQPQPQPSYDVP